MNVIEIIEIFKIYLIGKWYFYRYIVDIGLKRPVHRGFGCKL